MLSVLTLILQYFLFNTFILVILFLAGLFIRSHWPGWWERWIAAPYPEEYETADDYPQIQVR